MMNKAFIFISLSLPLVAQPGELAFALYTKDANHSHKIILQRSCRDPDEVIIDQLLCAFLMYRLGEKEAAIRAFRDLDYYLDHELTCTQDY